MWKTIDSVILDTWVLAGIDSTEEQFVAKKSSVDSTWLTPTGGSEFDAHQITRTFTHWMAIPSLPLVS